MFKCTFLGPGLKLCESEAGSLARPPQFRKPQVAPDPGEPPLPVFQ